MWTKLNRNPQTGEFCKQRPAAEFFVQFLGEPDCGRTQIVPCLKKNVESFMRAEAHWTWQCVIQTLWGLYVTMCAIIRRERAYSGHKYKFLNLLWKHHSRCSSLMPLHYSCNYMPAIAQRLPKNTTQQKSQTTKK